MGDRKKESGKKKKADSGGSGINVLDGGINKPYVINGGDANNMRFILPAFIHNERKHSQPERRKLRSSPMISRRFSDDSDSIGRNLNVSICPSRL